MNGVTLLLSRIEGSVNIGFISRAMANTGFKSLRFTSQSDIRDETAYKYALHSSDILDSADYSGSFDELTQQSDVIIGFSPRAPYNNALEFDQLKDTVTEAVASGRSVGLLFGNEASGLDNSELSACTYAVALPTSSEYISMNLAQAALVVMWELRDIQPEISLKPETADRQTKNRVTTILKDYLELIDYFKDQNPDPIWQEIRQIFESKELSQREAELLISVIGKGIVRYRHLLNKSR